MVIAAHILLQSTFDTVKSAALHKNMHIKSFTSVWYIESGFFLLRNEIFLMLKSFTTYIPKFDCATLGRLLLRAPGFCGLSAWAASN